MAENQRFALPEANLEELVTLFDLEVAHKIEQAQGREYFRLRDQLLPLLRLSEVLASPLPLSDADHYRITRKHQEEQKAALEKCLGKDKQRPIVFY